MDADASPETRGTMGTGDFPRELDRINWGAVLIPEMWAFFHQAWNWLALLVALNIGAFVFYGKFHQTVFSRTLAGELTGAIALAIVATTVHVLFGLKANEFVWWRAARRIGSAPADAQPVSAYVANSLTWARLGAAYLVIRPVVELGDLRLQKFSGLAWWAGLGVELAILTVVWLVTRSRTAHALRSESGSS